MRRRKPAYADGEPANLEAAAADAIEWLRILHKLLPRVHGGRHRRDQDRLAAAIAALAAYLPESEEKDV